MKAPILAPRPLPSGAAETTPAEIFISTSSSTPASTGTAFGGPLLAPERHLSLTHSDAEWTAAYPEIERLYVRERRKLRHVMQYMEREHNFSATVQMYKKRFAKWGFQKNARRQQTTATQATATAVARGAVARKPAGRIRKVVDSGFYSVPALPDLGPQDTLTLLLLTSVKTWSVSFFESPAMSALPLSETPDCASSPSASSFSSVSAASPLQRPRPNKAKEICFAFKLVIDLLERGRGDLAGRMARKAFLLVEDMLETLAAPALVWNLLEMMHHMVSVQQVQLFQMLLSHVINLVGNRPHVAGGHPLLALLHSLRGIVATASKEATSSTEGDETLRRLLAQAWTLNAEILFANFHPNLFHLYCCILWESCSIGPPAAIVGSVGQWFRTIDAVQMSSKRVVLPDDVLSPPQAPPPKPQADYARLHASSLAALRAHGDAILRDEGAGFQGDTALLLRMLAGLTTAKILQGMPDTTSVVVDFNGQPDENWELAHMPRIHLGNVACVIRTLVDIDAAKRGLKPSDNMTPAARVYMDMDAVEQIRAVVDLRTQSDGATDPQVVREMWLLQEALGAAGDAAEAFKVEQETYARIEQYVGDIPVDAA
ncbi:hypothetical protein Sste5346_006107 [Sporothrix stenoceras]|uniref:Clr5 domain-containing protein n=1 Tax=Sporothrix stenoceras TaxID=5173 RepID=A0ABR3Z194_9PEZI